MTVQLELLTPELQPTYTVEQWRPVVGYEGTFEISDEGRVRSVTGRILPLHRNGGGYPKVSLHGKGYLVHRLVLEAFIGPEPEGMQACHFNDVGHDNHLSNLRWDYPRANMADQIRNRRYKHQQSNAINQ